MQVFTGSFVECGKQRHRLLYNCQFVNCWTTNKNKKHLFCILPVENRLLNWAIAASAGPAQTNQANETYSAVYIHVGLCEGFWEEKKNLFPYTLAASFRACSSSALPLLVMCVPLPISFFYRYHSKTDVWRLEKSCWVYLFLPFFI